MEVRIESDSVAGCTPDARRDGARAEREPGDAARRSPTAADADDRLGQRRSSRFAPGGKRVVAGPDVWVACGAGPLSGARFRLPRHHVRESAPDPRGGPNSSRRGIRTPHATRVTNGGGRRDPPRIQVVVPVRCSSRASPDVRRLEPVLAERTRRNPSRARAAPPGSATSVWSVWMECSMAVRCGRTATGGSVPDSVLATRGQMRAACQPVLGGQLGCAQEP